MRALIFADRVGLELTPLTEKLAVPLLPVAGKELLIYTIEDLVGAGVRDLVVVATAHGEQAGASTLGDGERWGATIRYVLSRGEEQPAAVWSRLSLADAEAVLALRGDVLRSPITTEFLQQAQNKAGTSAFCGVGADPRGSLLLLRPECPAPGDLLDPLRWDQPRPLPAEGSCVVADVSLNCLESLAGFHRANLDLLAGRIPGLAIAGRTVALGLFAGRKASVTPKCLKKGVAYIGANSRVHPEAELLGEVVIGDDVVVDRAATIRDSVIFPRTYVGELVEVSNAIVANNYLIRVDTGALLKIDEAFLLGSLGATEGRAPVSSWDRLAGALLLLLSAPLWPIAAAAAALAGRGRLMVSGERVGNRSHRGGATAKVFTERCWNTSIPVLRHLPRLLAVIAGHLRLVGVSPLTPAEDATRTEDWQRVRDQSPVGLLGPTQIDLSDDAPLDERLLSDAFYARSQTWQRDMVVLLSGLKALFNGKGWRRNADERE
ncbi:NDP-sugar synthase [uncultured Thiodictyon sp.]|uniref:NDP-sugar synthase n=1 Tax=uncultured Thiodictyon sp. TaxID=1846217 RepID=UPI0025E27F53|nr:NDP-sugar synthase [uncultured Thiodictyon sp.]